MNSDQSPGRRARTKRGEPRPGGEPPRPWTDAFIRGLGRFILSVFFRQIEIVGEERFPTDRPVVVVANHFNSIVDGSLLTAYLPRMPRLLAASFLWDTKILVPIMEAAGVTPVFRQQDPGADRSRNIESFAKSWDLLAAGGVLALFPEGTSHSKPSVLPAKTGAARIVLEAEARFGPLRVAIVPVGLIFDAKSKFRSRALLQIGEPLEPAEILQIYLDGDEAERREAVRTLTAKIDESLATVILNYDSWEEAHLIARASALWGRPRPDLPTKTTLAESHQIRRAFLEGYEWMRSRHPQRTAETRAALAEYDELLTAAHLRDEQVGAAYPPVSVARFVARSAVALLIRLPSSIVGTLLNVFPYLTVKIIGNRFTADSMASWKIFPGILVFPVFWLLEALVLGLLAAGRLDPVWGIGTGLAVLIAAPLTGRVALTFHDVRRRLLHEARAWILLRTRKRMAQRITEKRSEVSAQLDELVELYRSGSGLEPTV